MSTDPNTLRQQARTALAAKAAGDPRYTLLVLMLTVRLQMQPEVVEREIEALAGLAPAAQHAQAAA
jgi:hypothetical protein